LPDTSLTCRDCGAPFVFTEAEQAFFEERGFTSPPKRCQPCRARNRQRRPGGSGDGRRRQGNPGAHEPPRAAVAAAAAAPPSHAPSGTVASDPHAGAQGPSDAMSPRRARRAYDGPLHAAVCSACAAETQVPFVPDGVRPVFCLPCLKQRTR
jgi:CxxC-x17-CxxC domain-containing protein